MTIKLAFFGTPPLAADFLERMLNDKDLPVEIVKVITQPDKPVGRSRTPTPSPVKLVATKYNIPCNFQLSTLNSQSLDVDIAIIYYYGEIIPIDVLRAPKYGFWNIHFSPLPKYRGTSPATFSLVMGDVQTAVSLVFTDERLDHGPLIAQETVDIHPDETRLELEERLHNTAYDLVIGKIREVAQGESLENWKSQLKPQDHSESTYTRFPTKDDGFIPFSILKKILENKDHEYVPTLISDYIKRNNLTLSNYQFSNSNSQIMFYNLYRALHPWPGIWTLIKLNGQEKRIKLTKLKMENGKIELEKVQLEGKNEVSFQQFNSAYHVF